jgi:hypothetical protein
MSDPAPSIMSTDDPLLDELAHLSLDDPTCTLRRVSILRDFFTDEDHKALDEKILKIFEVNVKYNIEPSWPGILCFITGGTDERLISIRFDHGEELLKSHQFSEILKKAWAERMFKEVRKLGT